MTTKDNTQVYRLMNHDSDNVLPRFENYTIEQYNSIYETNYKSAEEANEDDPEYAFTYIDMLGYLAEFFVILKLENDFDKSDILCEKRKLNQALDHYSNTYNVKVNESFGMTKFQRMYESNEIY